MGTFRQFLEIQQADIEKQALDDRINAADEGDFDNFAFNHLFGDKLRLVIPLKKDQDSTEYALEQALEERGYEVDITKGMAYSTVKTHKVRQKRGQKIGKLLNRLVKYSERPDDDADYDKPSEENKQWKTLLHWWEVNKDTIGSVDDEGLSIIISRSPIDVVRMSDFPGMQSCHAPPGKPGYQSGYWPCAAQEARTGGAIAYVVNNDDLEGVDLQASEVFDDPDRRDDTKPQRPDTTQGILPLQRLRLRRFSVKVAKGDVATGHVKGETEDILVPEDNTYGDRFTGFRDAVMNWARHAQRKVVDLKNPPDFKDAKLRGGSYQDSSADDIWNGFFGTHVYGKKSSEDIDEEGVHGPLSADRMQDLAEEAIKAHNYKHIFVNAEAEDAGEGETAYLSSWANMNFDFPIRYFIKVPDEDDFEISWGGKSDESTLGELIKDTLDIWTIENFYINEHNDVFTISADIREEGDARYGGPLERFEHWLDELDDFERDYDEHFSVVRDVLVERGFLKDWRENWEFRHFQGDVGETNTKNNLPEIMGEMQIGELDGIDVSKIQINTSRSLQFKGRMSAKDVFPKFMEDDNIMLVARTSSYVAPHPNYPGGRTRNNLPEKGVIEAPIPVVMIVKFKLPADMVGLSRINARIRHLDNYWEYYYRRAVQWWKGWKETLLPQSGAQPQGLGRIRWPRYPRPTIQKTFPFAVEPEGEFKDWFTSLETKDGFLSGLQLARPKRG